MAGAMMGCFVHTIVAPIERSKLQLQTQESNLAIFGSGRRRFKGMLDCIVRTVREEGILSLWRGNGSSVLRYYPSVALNFSLKKQPFLSTCANALRNCSAVMHPSDATDELTTSIESEDYHHSEPQRPPERLLSTRKAISPTS